MLCNLGTGSHLAPKGRDSPARFSVVLRLRLHCRNFMYSSTWSFDFLFLCLRQDHSDFLTALCKTATSTGGRPSLRPSDGCWRSQRRRAAACWRVKIPPASPQQGTTAPVYMNGCLDLVDLSTFNSLFTKALYTQLFSILLLQSRGWIRTLISFRV